MPYHVILLFKPCNFAACHFFWFLQAESEALLFVKETVRWYGSRSIACYFIPCEIIRKRNFTIIYELYINNGRSYACNETWSTSKAQLRLG